MSAVAIGVCIALGALALAGVGVGLYGRHLAEYGGWKRKPPHARARYSSRPDRQPGS